MLFSTRLTAAVDQELAAAGRSREDPEAVLGAIEHLYATQGDAPFDAANAADMLAREIVIAEALEGLGEDG
jgi:hypothetical protein